MAKNDTLKDLKVALDEETSERELLRLWRNSRSVRVRKAVASNPNAGTKVLREASRLYLEEVIGNPGFAMLELFNDDPWISKISKAYSDPWDFLLGDLRNSYHARAGQFDHFGWAALLSPKLDAPALERVMNFMTTTAFRRAIKHRPTMDRVQYLYAKANLLRENWPFSLETVILFYQEGVISQKDLLESLSNFGAGSTSARKSRFIKYVRDLHKEYLTSRSMEDAENVAKVLAKSMVISRAHAMNWLWGCFDPTEEQGWAGELYSKVLRYMISFSAKSKRTGLIQDNMRAVGGVVVSFIKGIITDNPTERTLSKAYQFILSNGLDGEKFSKYGLILRGSSVFEELNKCDIEAKEFFCRAGCMGAWVSATECDWKYRIINEVNDRIYAREGVVQGNLLFNKCSVRKVITLDESTLVF